MNSSSTVGIVVFVIYAIVLFALLAPNVLIHLPKKYSDTTRILIHVSIFSVVLGLSYLVWSLVQIPQASASPSVVSSISGSSVGSTVIYSTDAPTYNNNSVVVRRPPSMKKSSNPNAVSYPNSSYPSMRSPEQSSPSPSPSPIPSSNAYKAFDHTYNSGYSTYSDAASRHYKEDHVNAAQPLAKLLVTASEKPLVTATGKPPVTATGKSPVTATVKPPVTATGKPLVTASEKPPVTATVKPPVTATEKPPVFAQPPPVPAN
jgi:hypothetical protein